MDHSAFNKLAAEVRNLIYHFALVQDDDIHLDAEQHDEWYCMAQIHSDSDKKRMLALTCICKQIRNESLPFFLGNNHFKVTLVVPFDGLAHFLIKPHTSMILCWMVRLGPWTSCLRCLQIEVQDIAVRFGFAANLAWAVQELRFGLDRRKLDLNITSTASWTIKGEDYSLTVAFHGHDHLIGPNLDPDSTILKTRLEQEVSDEILKSSIFADIDEIQRAVAQSLELISESS